MEKAEMIDRLKAGLTAIGAGSGLQAVTILEQQTVEAVKSAQKWEAECLRLAEVHKERLKQATLRDQELTQQATKMSAEISTLKAEVEKLKTDINNMHQHPDVKKAKLDKLNRDMAALKVQKAALAPEAEGEDK